MDEELPSWPDSSPERSPRRSPARDGEGRLAARRLRVVPAAPIVYPMDGPRDNSLMAELMRAGNFPSPPADRYIIFFSPLYI